MIFLAPAFTLNRIKMMFPVILDCGKQLQQHLSKVINPNESIEMFELIACFVSNIIASAAFGIDIDCLANPNHPF